MTRQKYLKQFYQFLILIFLNNSCEVAFSQVKNSSNNYLENLSDSLNAPFGLNPLLINGKPYIFVLDNKIEGTPFLESDEFKNGEILIKGNRFNNLQLNYDIHTQEALIKYDDINGSSCILRTTKEWLQKFTIDNKLFIIDNNGDLKKIYQVIGDKPIQLYYYFYKTLELVEDVKGAHYAFKPTRFTYIKKEGVMYEYHNNRSFVKVFEPSKQPNIKKYLKSNRVNVKNASDNIMEQLINNCNNI